MVQVTSGVGFGEAIDGEIPEVHGLPRRVSFGVILTGGEAGAREFTFINSADGERGLLEPPEARRPYRLHHCRQCSTVPHPTFAGFRMTSLGCVSEHYRFIPVDEHAVFNVRAHGAGEDDFFQIAAFAN